MKTKKEKLIEKYFTRDVRKDAYTLRILGETMFDGIGARRLKYSTLKEILIYRLEKMRDEIVSETTKMIEKIRTDSF